jgi:hypothetical protein
MVRRTNGHQRSRVTSGPREAGAPRRPALASPTSLAAAFRGTASECLLVHAERAPSRTIAFMLAKPRTLRSDRRRSDRLRPTRGVTGVGVGQLLRQRRHWSAAKRPNDVLRVNGRVPGRRSSLLLRRAPAIREDVDSRPSLRGHVASSCRGSTAARLLNDLPTRKDPRCSPERQGAGCHCRRR